MSQIYAPNQSISYSQGNQSLDIIPSTGLVITSGVNHLTINSTELTNGTQTLLFSDIYTTVGKCDAITYPADAPTTLNVTDTILVTNPDLVDFSNTITADSIVQSNTGSSHTTAWDASYLTDGIQSTMIRANLATFEKVGDTHQTHMDNTQVHILDTATLDEMFIDHNSLILVQQSTTHQTELLGNMLDFQTPENIISCGHTTYQNGGAGFEAYDLLTGNNTLLTPTQLAFNTSSGYLHIQQNQFQMNVGYDAAIITPTVVSVQGITDKQVNHFNNKIEFVESLVTVNTLDHNWSGGIKSEATSMAANHYLLGSMSATTSSDKAQKNSNIYFNPSLLTLYAPTFNGQLVGIADTAKAVSTFTSNVATTCYIPFFTSTAGTNKIVYVDDTTGPLTYVPSTGILTAATFSGALSGNATSATTVSTLSDNTAGSYYLPFVKTTALVTPNQQLYIDDTTIPLSYNPSTGVITATNFTGSVTGTASLATTAANVNLGTTLNLATFTLGTTLTITGASTTSFKNSNIIFTGTTNTVSILTLVTTQINAEYNLGIYNGGSGNVTFNTGLGTNIRTMYSSGVNIAPGTYGYMNIRVLTINALTVYVVSVTQLT